MDIKGIVAYYKGKLESSPVKTLWPEERYALYTSFGPLTSVDEYYQREKGNLTWQKNYHDAIRTRLANRTKGDMFIGWLAILTAEKLLPIWQRNQEQGLHPLCADTAQDMLEWAEEVLVGSPKLDRVLYWSGDFHTSLGIEFAVTFEVGHSLRTAYLALETIIFGDACLEPIYPGKNGMNYNPGEDFAEIAVQAYSASDPNLPEFEREGPALPIIFDQAKQAEFWNWWLTKAVPQAWQLAQQSYPPKQVA